MADETGPTGPTGEEEKTGISPRLVGALVLVVLALIFVFENTSEVTIRFLIPKAKVHVWAALVVALAIGVLVGYLGARHRRKR